MQMKAKTLFALTLLSIMAVVLVSSQSQGTDYPNIPKIPYLSASPFIPGTKNPQINYNAPQFPNFGFLNAGTPNTGFPNTNTQSNTGTPNTELPLNTGFPSYPMSTSFNPTVDFPFPPSPAYDPSSFFSRVGVNQCCSQELITNGDFQNNKCNSRYYCVYNSNSIGSALPGWTPKPQIEIGRPSYYNNNVGSNTVLELDADSNTCVEQIIRSCGSGTYSLKFDHAARKGQSLGTSAFIVKMNGNVVDTFSHTSYAALSEKRSVQLQKGQNTLAFCGSGASDRYGAIIDNVSIRCSNY